MGNPRSFAKIRRFALLAGSLVLAAATARAQPADPIADLLENVPAEAPVAAAAVVHAGAQTLSAADVAQLRRAIDSARRGDINGARAARDSLSDTLAREVATWVLADADGDSLGFGEIDAARRQLADWPRAVRRQASAERQLSTSGLTPTQVLAWFGDDDPVTAHGAMALASAEQSLGRFQDAQTLIRHWWRDKSFSADTQRDMLARFAGLLTQDDHVRRVDIMLYAANPAAARDLLPLLPPDEQQAAEARLALKANAANASDVVSALPADVANEPGVVFEHAAYLRRHNLDNLALALVKGFPRDLVTDDQERQVWAERRQLILVAMKQGDAKAAYAAADGGFDDGIEAAESEFYAGWLALTRLNEPEVAMKHFATLDRIGASPITRARALYWEARASEAMHDDATAHSFYVAASAHSTTFYGQLAAEKLGHRLILASDPQILPEDRERFEARPAVQAARLLYDLGYRDLYRVFVVNLDDMLPTAADEALLVDMVRGYGDQELSMRVARAAAQRGFILPQRAYPMRIPPEVEGAPEPALVLGVTRQESGFDPNIRSGAGARGMMQLMPSTAAIVARRIGVSYSPGKLNEPDYNMRLGSSFLGQLVDRFSGSYVMAVAAYNAGPGRPTQWANWCGDPRGGSTDPVNFIECIPFSETRNYVMRVLENMEVYRAKLAGGATKITLAGDLRRGAYGYAAASPPPLTTAAQTP